MRLDKDKWQKAFEKELDKAEKRQSSKVRRYYKNQYYKGAESFLSSGQTSFQLLFNTSELIKIYRDLYSDIGLQFAKWYARSFDKYIKKGVNPNQYVDEWQNSFASYGSAVGAERVTLVSGTAKATLVKVTQNLMTDIDFQNLGIAEKTRILRSQFNRYSAFQAERLVRTEATNAANFATLKSANTVFPAADMMKEWIASFDDRTRSTHAEAGASEPVPQNEPFMVGGALMMYPGDPNGDAKEVINCRCSIAPFPKETAQATGEITDINFGLGGGTRTGYGLGDVVSFANSLTIKEAEEFLIKNNISKKVNYSGLTLKEANLINETIFNNYLKINKTFDFEPLDYIKTLKGERYMFRASNGLDINLDQIRLNINELNSSTKILRLEKKIERKLRNLQNYSLEEQKIILENIKVWKGEIENLKNIKLFYGENLSDFITHEFGHFVENKILRNKNNFNLINDFADSKFRNANNINFQNTLQSKLDFISYQEGVKISEYASKNSLEYIAEAWVAFIKNDYSVIDNNLLKIFKKITDGY